MKSTPNKPPDGRPARPGQRESFKPVGARPQPHLVQPHVARPAAPPVYRPQPTPRVLQTKQAVGARPQAASPAGRPAAPPVFRPQPAPAVLQAKTRDASQPAAPQPPAPPRRPPSAPAPYRPQPAPKVLQPKAAAVTTPRVARPHIVPAPRAQRHAPPSKPRTVLPRPAHGVARQTAVQRYAVNGTQKISQNNHYVTDSANAAVLYVHPAAPAPQPAGLIAATGATTNINGTLYQHYAYDLANHAFTNDCLKFAENLARNVDVDSNRAEFRGLGDNPGGAERLFGDTYQKNINIANGAWATDNATNPAIGEAYATSRTVASNLTQYHAALVVAKDGQDNVTLEADNGAPLAAPVFDIYDTVAGNPGSNTFHQTYSGTYTTNGNAPHTGTLRLRND